MGRKLFCQISPATYRISMEKEILKRHARDFFSRETIADVKTDDLEYIIKSHFSIIRRRLEGVDMALQENKRINLAIAAEQINGLVVYPSQSFSFWHCVGRPTRKKGYADGLVISSGNLESDVGGGLCRLANMIHFMVLHSPLTVTELHHHTDALFPDDRRRVPFGTGTSVLYNYIDYRFRNNTDRPFQIKVWTDKDMLLGELRSTHELPFRYRLQEEDHHFSCEDGVMYRCSKVYRLSFDKVSGEKIGSELILDNHSKVMYDYSLIPKEEIR